MFSLNHEPYRYTQSASNRFGNSLDNHEQDILLALDLKMHFPQNTVGKRT